MLDYENQFERKIFKSEVYFVAENINIGRNER